MYGPDLCLKKSTMFQYYLEGVRKMCVAFTDIEKAYDM